MSHITRHRTEFRHATFGEFGIKYFKVDDAAELITIFNVTWVG